MGQKLCDNFRYEEVKGSLLEKNYYVFTVVVEEFNYRPHPQDAILKQIQASLWQITNKMRISASISHAAVALGDISAISTTECPQSKNANKSPKVKTFSVFPHIYLYIYLYISRKIETRTLSRRHGWHRQFHERDSHPISK